MPLQETPTDGPNNSAAPVAAAAAPAPAQAPAMPAPAPAPAAASIPNLLDRLRPAGGARGSRRGGLRGGGRARAPIPPGYDMPPGHNMHPPWSRTMPAASSHSSHSGGRPLTVSQRTSNIQGTDTDAALSRLSAVGVGLLDDRFAQYFAGEDGEPAPRRLPIINRGTYIRTMALDKMIEAVLAAGGDSPRQIVSLGAGTDTRALRMLTRQKQQQPAISGPPYKNVIYHEIDFPRTSDRKRAIVEAVPAIRALLDGPVTQHAAATTTATSWSVGLGNNNVLYSHGLDLRELNEGFTEVLPGYQSHVPTLVVSECCLCYLLPEEAQSVLGYFVKAAAAAAAAAEAAQPSTSTGIGIILYEPIHLNDSFGRTMVTNLAARGIEMPTLAAWPDGPSQTARLAQQLSGGGGGGDGDAQADHRTIDQIWDTWVPEAEKARVNALEGLDEEEEWKLLASHYVVAWGHRGDFFRTVWKHLEAVPEVTEE